jgi:hypothetical protein
MHSSQALARAGIGPSTGSKGCFGRLYCTINEIDVCDWAITIVFAIRRPPHLKTAYRVNTLATDIVIKWKFKGFRIETQSHGAPRIFVETTIELQPPHF